MDHLIAGERSPKALAQLARARARRKIAELEAALEGAEFFTPAHAALLAAMLGRIDRVNAEIARLTEVLERLLAPYEEQLQQAESMPGWGRRAAQDAVAETGTDMSRFPTGAPGLLGRPHPPGQLLRQAQGEGQVQERQPVPRRPARRDRRRSRQDPDPRGRPLRAAGPPPWQGQSPGRPRQHPAEGLPRPAVQPRHPVSGSRPGLLRTPGQYPPADRPPRRQARRPRLRSHPLPYPRTRTRRHRQHPGRLTHTRPQALTGPDGQGPLPPAQLRSYFRVSPGPGGVQQAAFHPPAIQQDRARPALTVVAPLLGTGKTQPLPQHIQQRAAVVHGEAHFPPVHRQRDPSLRRRRRPVGPRPGSPAPAGAPRRGPPLVARGRACSHASRRTRRGPPPCAGLSPNTAAPRRRGPHQVASLPILNRVCEIRLRSVCVRSF